MAFEYAVHPAVALNSAGIDAREAAGISIGPNDVDAIITEQLNRLAENGWRVHSVGFDEKGRVSDFVLERDNGSSPLARGLFDAQNRGL